MSVIERRIGCLDVGSYRGGTLVAGVVSGVHSCVECEFVHLSWRTRSISRGARLIARVSKGMFVERPDDSRVTGAMSVYA